MILGPLGLRANKWINVAGKYELVSPSRQDFAWQSAIAWSKCDKCPKDDDGHVMIQENCSCGIYSTVSVDILREYIYNYNSIVCVVEALDAETYKKSNGYIWMHEMDNGDYPEIDPKYWNAGITSPGVLVTHLVDSSFVHKKQGYNPITHGHALSQSSLATIALAQQWHMQIITIEEALGICKIQWEKFGLKWRGQ